MFNMSTNKWYYDALLSVVQIEAQWSNRLVNMTLKCIYLFIYLRSVPFSSGIPVLFEVSQPHPLCVFAQSEVI